MAMADIGLDDTIMRSGQSSAKRRALTKQGKLNQSRILDAALTVFAQYGLRGSRLDQIAEAAGLSKTNLLYYVRSKDELYLAVLSRTLSMWLEPLEAFDNDSNPRAAITSYIERKLEYSRDYPEASRLFAYEIMQGAPILNLLLENDLKQLVDAKTEIMKRWIAEGRMNKADPRQVIFVIWATTQHHADFAAQTRAVTGMDLSDPNFFEQTRQALVSCLTCGLFDHP